MVPVGPEPGEVVVVVVFPGLVVVVVVVVVVFPGLVVVVEDEVGPEPAPVLIFKDYRLANDVLMPSFNLYEIKMFISLISNRHGNRATTTTVKDSPFLTYSRSCTCFGQVFHVTRAG